MLVYNDLNIDVNNINKDISILMNVIIMEPICLPYFEVNGQRAIILTKITVEQYFALVYQIYT